MRIARPALCLALVASLSAAGFAGAATRPKPKPVCKIITDVTGDSALTTATPVGSDDAFDIVSGDLAANAKTITGVIRVAKAGDPSTAPFGHGFVMTFSAPGSANPLYLRYSSSPAFGEAYEFGYDDPTNGLTTLGDASGVVDTAKNEIRISAPLRGFDAQAVIKPGMKLTNITAQTSRDFIALLIYADVAESSKSYVVGYPSCVVPGK